MTAAAEWSGAFFGLLGSFLLATHSSVSRYGWLAYLLANLAMLAFAATISAYGLLVQQVGFTATTVLGMYRAGFLWTTPADLSIDKADVNRHELD